MRARALWRRPSAWMAAALAAAALAVAPLLAPPPRSEAGAVDSLAVLPFEHPPGDPELAALAGGLAERITHHLARLDGLAVVAQSSAARLAGEAAAPGEAAERLGVGAVVVGRLSRRGGALAVGAELVDAASGRQLWGDRFDATSGDLLALERELSREIAAALERRLGAGGRRLGDPGTADAAAHRRLLEGLHHQRQGRLDEALAAYRAAVAADPDYAPAWAALGSAWAYRGFFGGGDAEADSAAARRAVDRALALDPDLADAWVTRATATFFADGDLGAALADVERAVALDPGSAAAWYTRGALLIAADRPQEALAALDRSLALDPLNPPVRMMQARAHLRRGDLAAAARASRENLALYPEFIPSRWLLVRALALAGRSDEAREEAAALAGQRSRADAAVELALLSGRPEVAERLVAEREAAWSAAAGPERAGAERPADSAGRSLASAAPAERTAAAAVDLAFHRSRLGDHAAALEWLDAALGLPGGRIAVYQILPDPEIDPLRPQPRFRALLAAMDAPASFAAAPARPGEPAAVSPDPGGRL